MINQDCSFQHRLASTPSSHLVIEVYLSLALSLKFNNYPILKAKFFHHLSSKFLRDLPVRSFFLLFSTTTTNKSTADPVDGRSMFEAFPKFPLIYEYIWIQWCSSTQKVLYTQFKKQKRWSNQRKKCNWSSNRKSKGTQQIAIWIIKI